jgi:type IV pilus assembly protein PilX
MRIEEKFITRQPGVALPVTLIFLVVMTMIGVAAIRNVTLEEKMSGNLRSQQLAFEAAEQVLRYCEALIQAMPQSNPAAYPQLEAGPITGDSQHGKNHWELAAGWRSHAISIALPASVASSADLAEAPRCMIEKMALASDREFQLNPADQLLAYRITARGIGTSSNVAVILQSYLRL